MVYPPIASLGGYIHWCTSLLASLGWVIPCFSLGREPPWVGYSCFTLGRESPWVGYSLFYSQKRVSQGGFIPCFVPERGPPGVGLFPVLFPKESLPGWFYSCFISEESLPGWFIPCFMSRLCSLFASFTPFLPFYSRSLPKRIP